MKKFISANEEIVHKQDAEIRRLASMIRRMDDDVCLRRFTKVPSLRCDSCPSEKALGVFFSTFEAVRTPNRARMHSKSEMRPPTSIVPGDDTRHDCDAPRRPSRSGKNMIA